MVNLYFTQIQVAICGGGGYLMPSYPFDVMMIFTLEVRGLLRQDQWARIWGSGISTARRSITHIVLNRAMYRHFRHIIFSFITCWNADILKHHIINLILFYQNLHTFYYYVKNVSLYSNFLSKLTHIRTTYFYLVFISSV